MITHVVLFKLKDRKQADLVLAMTHEEAVTNHVAREVRSYQALACIQRRCSSPEAMGGRSTSTRGAPSTSQRGRAARRWP